MPRGPLYENGYQPRFSGHETFPLRYGWLKKAVDAAAAAQSAGLAESVFSADDAIARFGVGKNMVASIRHWAEAAGVIDPAASAPTPLGRRLFAPGGLDPWMENPAAAWTIHWRLCGNPRKTTWFWAFSHFPALFFERALLTATLEKLALERGWRFSIATLKNDVACFVRTYAAQPPSGKASCEDTLESPLTELGLIRPLGRRDGFRFMRGGKPSLGAGVFCYAVTDFWSRFPDARNTLSFEALAHEPGSPGRVFLLEENDLADRLADLGKVSGGLYDWSETTGLKQLTRKRKATGVEALDFLAADYPARNGKGSA